MKKLFVLVFLVMAYATPSHAAKWLAVCNNTNGNCPGVDTSAVPYKHDGHTGWMWNGTEEELCGTTGNPNMATGWIDDADHGDMDPDTGICRDYCTNGLDIDTNPDCGLSVGNECPEGAIECDEYGNPSQCDTGYTYVQQINGSTSCAADAPQQDCNAAGAVGMYLDGDGFCATDEDTCAANNGTYGHVGTGASMQPVCLGEDYADQLPSCSPGSYHTISNGDGSSAFACSTPTDNPDGTNNVDSDGDGEFDGTCVPTETNNCANQEGHQDSDGDGLPDTPDVCLGSNARECRYEPCAQDRDSAACNACVANPLGAACHSPCSPGQMSDGNQCVDDPNAQEQENTGEGVADGLEAFCNANPTASMCRDPLGVGDCDPRSEDYLICLSSGGTSVNHTENTFGTFDEVLTDFGGRVSASEIGQLGNAIGDAFPSSSGTCPAFNFELYGEDVGTNLHCEIYTEIAPLLAVAFYAMWTILGIRIVMEA